MTPDEAVAILSDLAIQFESLDDLVNNDWKIFTYTKEPPWFMFAMPWWGEAGWPRWSREKKLETIAEPEYAALRARIIDVLAALRLASETVGVARDD